MRLKPTVVSTSKQEIFETDLFLSLSSSSPFSLFYEILDYFLIMHYYPSSDFGFIFVFSAKWILRRPRRIPPFSLLFFPREPKSI